MVFQNIFFKYKIHSPDSHRYIIANKYSTKVSYSCDPNIISQVPLPVSKGHLAKTSVPSVQCYIYMISQAFLSSPFCGVISLQGFLMASCSFPLHILYQDGLEGNGMWGIECPTYDSLVEFLTTGVFGLSAFLVLQCLLHNLCNLSCASWQVSVTQWEDALHHCIRHIASHSLAFLSLNNSHQT